MCHFAPRKAAADPAAAILATDRPDRRRFLDLDSRSRARKGEVAVTPPVVGLHVEVPVRGALVRSASSFLSSEQQAPISADDDEVPDATASQRRRNSFMILKRDGFD